MDWTSQLILLLWGINSRLVSKMTEKSPELGRNSTDNAIHKLSLGSVSRCKPSSECISKAPHHCAPAGSKARARNRSVPLLISWHPLCPWTWSWAGSTGRNPGEDWHSEWVLRRSVSWVLRPDVFLRCTTNLHCLSRYSWCVRPFHSIAVTVDYPQRDPQLCNFWALWRSHLGPSIVKHCQKEWSLWKAPFCQLRLWPIRFYLQNHFGSKLTFLV